MEMSRDLRDVELERALLTMGIIQLGIAIPGSRIPGSRDPGPLFQSRNPGIAVAKSRHFGIEKKSCFRYYRPHSRPLSQISGQCSLYRRTTRATVSDPRTNYGYLAYTYTLAVYSLDLNRPISMFIVHIPYEREVCSTWPVARTLLC